MDFKERIFQARKAKGFSQEDLAELVGVSRQAVSKWETGEAMPDMEKLIALCDTLEQNMEYLALGKESAVPVDTVKKNASVDSCSFGGSLSCFRFFTGILLAQSPDADTDRSRRKPFLPRSDRAAYF